MKKPTTHANKVKARRIAAKAERLNGTTLNGKADGKTGRLHYSQNENRRLHPKRPKTWEDFQAAKLASINDPGLQNEEAMLEALSFERESRDARIWQEAIAAERTSWGRSR